MSLSAAQLEARITALEELRASGLASSGSDGTSDSYRSLEELNAEIGRLRTQLAALKGYATRHPYARAAF